MTDKASSLLLDGESVIIAQADAQERTKITADDFDIHSDISIRTTDDPRVASIGSTAYTRLGAAEALSQIAVPISGTLKDLSIYEVENSNEQAEKLDYSGRHVNGIALPTLKISDAVTATAVVNPLSGDFSTKVQAHFGEKPRAPMDFEMSAEASDALWENMRPALDNFKIIQAKMMEQHDYRNNQEAIAQFEVDASEEFGPPLPANAQSQASTGREK